MLTFDQGDGYTVEVVGPLPDDLSIYELREAASRIGGGGVSDAELEHQLLEVTERRYRVRDHGPDYWRLDAEGHPKAIRVSISPVGGDPGAAQPAS